MGADDSQALATGSRRPPRLLFFSDASVLGCSCLPKPCSLSLSKEPCARLELFLFQRARGALGVTSTYSAITGALQAPRSPEGPAPAPRLSHMRRTPGPKQSHLRTFTKDIEDCKIKQSRPSPFAGRGCRINRWMTSSQGGWSYPGRLSRQAAFSSSPRQRLRSALPAPSPASFRKQGLRLGFSS